MTDVRLTALNPEDSKVYPVACNSSGELLTTKGSDINLDVPGNLTVGGSAEFAGGKIEAFAMGRFDCYRQDTGTSSVFNVYSDDGGTKVEKFRVNCNGSGEFASTVNTGNWPNSGATSTGGGGYLARQDVGTSVVWKTFSGGLEDINITSQIYGNGSASFAGDVVVGSRSRSWMLVEQGGLCHMVEQTRASTADLVDDYPKLRDVFNELNMIESALQEIMDRLRLTPPAGWEVWDGSNDSR